MDAGLEAGFNKTGTTGLDLALTLDRSNVLVLTLACWFLLRLAKPAGVDLGFVFSWESLVFTQDC